MKCIFIYNPVSGKGKIAKKLDYIVAGLKEKYEEVDVYATKCSGDLAVKAKEVASQYDAIVFAGGDGSFNEVLQGVAPLENPPELGYIPSGTVNDIAHTLKIPKNIKKALKVIQEGRREWLDCMKANNHYVMYVVAAGAFTSATYTTSQISKNQVGRIAYFVEGVKKNLHFSVFGIDCEGQEDRENTHSVLVSFMNSRYVAGFRVNRLSSLQDGKIEVAIVQQKIKPNFFDKIKALFSVAKLFLFGYKAKSRKGIVCLEGASFDVDVGEDVVWNFDGEKGTSGKLHIEVLPAKIKMIVPKKLKKV
ncbi:MAG: YegS/Rv2252/BmrU family lipid kinase [Clostridia bacterium]|nr:YegS/Rv2252/BmrU family lipid kinase [Clostridia bacterium]